MVQQGLTLGEFRPRPALSVPEHLVARPKFPVIDAHNHLGELCPGVRLSDYWPSRPVTELIDVMDAAGVRVIVDLDGQSGQTLKREMARYVEKYPSRFVIFHGMDYSIVPRERNFGEALARDLRESVKAGAKGLKIWKRLGLSLRDESEKLVAVNDPRLDVLWATAGELGVPVLVHVADPVAFFRPLDRFNERWEELGAHPDWHFPSPPFPSFMTIMEQFADVIARHGKTNFIGAHVGCYAENLQWVSQLMDRCPNFYVDISARLAELGRQPYSARDFFIRHADRILFGSDQPANVEMYRVHYRFLETRDEYFPYWVGDLPPQGRWMIYGLFLPDDVLRKVYYENAQKLLKISVV